MVRNIILVLWILLFLFPCYSMGEDFMGVPIIPNSKIISKGDKDIQFVVNMSHDQVLKFYKDVLKGQADIRIREWKDSTYIEDDGNRKWHSITIYRKPINDGIKVVIKKDNWTWIMGTLVLRYVGVFFVLMTLLLALSVLGKIVSTIVKKIESKQES